MPHATRVVDAGRPPGVGVLLVAQGRGRNEIGESLFTAIPAEFDAGRVGVDHPPVRSAQHASRR